MCYLPWSETGSKLMLRVRRHCLQRLLATLQKLPTMQRSQKQDPTKCSIEKVYCTVQATMLVLWKGVWARRSREPLQELWKSARRSKESCTIESSFTNWKRTSCSSLANIRAALVKTRPSTILCKSSSWSCFSKCRTLHCKYQIAKNWSLNWCLTQ